MGLMEKIKEIEAEMARTQKVCVCIFFRSSVGVRCVGALERFEISEFKKVSNTIYVF